MQEFRFVILGAGSIAHKFADAVRRTPGASVAAVASKSAEKAAAFAEKYGLIPICGQDFHYEEAMQGIMTRFHGEVKDMKTLVSKLFAREYDMILPGNEIRSAKQQ